MKKKITGKITWVLIISTIMAANLRAQERNDVIKVYNEGARAIQTDVQAAITAFENVVTLSDKVGESVNDLRQKAVQVLPGLYVKAASNALSEKKPAAEVIKAAREAAKAADKYGSVSAKENAEKILMQGYYNMGTGYFSSKDYDNALLAFDSILAINPDFTSAIYNKALIYRIQNNLPGFEENIDLFIAKEKEANETARADQASKLALELFRAAGSQANQENKLDEALSLLNKAAKYGDDKDLCYYFADVFNKQKDFEKGEAYAQKGLDMETGDAEAKAKFFFELGLAQEGKGKIAEACASFKNALYGPFAQAAKAKRTNLKCQ